MEKQLTVTPPAHANFWKVNPIRKLSLRSNGSTLYDSFELRAMTHQLNKAIQGSSMSSLPYMHHLKSASWCRQIERINSKSTNTSGAISCTQSTHAFLDERKTRSCSAGRGNIISRLWKKVNKLCGGTSRGRKENQISNRGSSLGNMQID